MIEDFHNKRKDTRRSEDGHLKFLLTIVKLATRLKEVPAIHSVLLDAVDTIEKGERI